MIKIFKTKLKSIWNRSKQLLSLYKYSKIDLNIQINFKKFKYK